MTHADSEIARKDLDAMQSVLRHLACPVRLEILCRLIDGPIDVTSLAEALQLGMSVVSGHLSHLSGCDLVLRSAVGRHRLYRLSSRVQTERQAGGVEFIVTVGPGLGVVFSIPNAAIFRLLGEREGPTTEALPRHPPPVPKMDILWQEVAE